MNNTASLVHENIAEIGMLVGFLISSGALPKYELDLPSDTISAAITKWGIEFEKQYGKHAPDWYQAIPELGNPIGYMDAIDNFTTKKLFGEDWLTDEYVKSLEADWLER